MRRNFLMLLCTALWLGCVGGDPEPLPPGQADTPSETPQKDPQSTAGTETTSPVISVEAQVPNNAPTAPAAAPPATQPPAPVDTTATNLPAPGMERVAAQAGVGKKGQGYGGGIITEPISAYFKTRDRMAFGVQIPHGMKLFHATNNRYPKDMAEFQKVILGPAHITLPELPEGHRYVYDPTQVDLSNGETGLMVERPR